jgi:hypothetical protein
MKKPFVNAAHPLAGLDGKTVGDFWQWAYSDLLSNGNRAVLAEYVVGAALGCVDSPRLEWDKVDLRYGDLSVEVKSAAACQSWKQKRPSRISFNIRKSTGWDATKNESAEQAGRNSDVYVFCHYPEPDPTRADASNIKAWDFYVVLTKTLDRELPDAKTASLETIRKLGPRCGISRLRDAVNAARDGRPSERVGPLDARAAATAST